MKKSSFILSLAATGISLQFLPALAKIREVNSMMEIMPSIDQNSVLVFDLDNTIMEPVQTLGSDQFFGLLLQKALNQGLDKKNAVGCALKYATFVQPVTKVRTVEPVTLPLIFNLQNHGIHMMGLTARPIEWRQNTIEQLGSVHVDFTKTPLAAGNIPAGPKFAGIYYNGVLFMDKEGDKGQYLIEFLKQVGSDAKTVIFVDDKLNNVQSVEKALNTTDLQHISFRYGAADSEVKAFNSDLAGFEWQYFLHFGEFLTDQRAKDLMPAGGIGDWNLDCAN